MKIKDIPFRLEVLKDKQTFRLIFYENQKDNTIWKEFTLTENEYQNLIIGIEDASGLDRSVFDKIEIVKTLTHKSNPFVVPESLSQGSMIFESKINEPAYKRFKVELDRIKEEESNSYGILLIVSANDIGLLEGQKITNAAGEFMEAMGFELHTKQEPVKGSFWQRLKFILKSPKTEKELTEIYEKAKLALESKYLGNPTADETLKLANAASGLLNSIQTEKSIAIRCERILILKYPDTSGNPIISIQTISPALGKFLDENPQCLLTPSAVAEIIKSQLRHSIPKGLGEGEGIQSGA